MIKFRVQVVVATAALAVAGAVRADLYPSAKPGLGGISVDYGVMSATDSAAKPMPGTIRVSEAGAGRLTGADFAPERGVTGILLWPAYPQIDRSGAVNPGPVGTPANAVHELPPLPGSAAMYLSAVASIGGWYVMRSASNLRWGAPRPVGHFVGSLVFDSAASFELDFGGQPLCDFQPVTTDVRRYSFLRSERDPRAHGDWLTSLALVVPRGPPIP